MSGAPTKSELSRVTTAGPIFPAAERLASAIARTVDSATDVRTLTAWGRSVGASRGALRAWRYAADVPPKNALDFTRLFRAVYQAALAEQNPSTLLDIVDERTFRRL